MFWLVAALLLAGALLMLLPPLWQPRTPPTAITAGGANLSIYQDQAREAEHDLATGLIAPEHFAQSRSDIQRRLLEDVPAPVAGAGPRAARGTAIALALLIPAASVLSYLALGDRQALTSVARQPAEPATAADRHSVTPAQIEQMVGALSERLKADPGNAEGWMMLARSYTALGRYPDAVIAFRRAQALAPANASLLADCADVLGMVQGKRLAGEPARLVQQALDVDPRHVKSLALAGSVSFEAHDYAAARGYWERLVAVVPADSDIARSVQGSIAQARKLDTDGSSTPPLPSAQAPVAASGSSLAGNIGIGPELAQRVAPGDTLFIFARAAQGPRMPLAIIKRAVGPWPAHFVLDDAMAMAPNLKLSGFRQVVVTARISRSGSATPQPGDLIGQSPPIAPGAADLRITIDRVQP
jgi:cytochrome c-type biogenesis protein CcmH